MFLFWERVFLGIDDLNTVKSGPISALVVKRHLNGVSLAGRQRPNIIYIECSLERFVIFRGSGPVLLRNPIFFVIFEGGGGCGPPAPSSHANCTSFLLI